MAFRAQIDAVQNYMREKSISPACQRDVVHHMILVYEKYQ